VASSVGERETDVLIAAVADEVARRMSAFGRAGALLREREHLDPITKDVLESLTGDRSVSRRLATADFPGVGAVDVVHGAPPLLVELKWSYELPGKVFESAWDAVKLALLGPAHGTDALYLMTGAARDEWQRSESADLFATGELDPRELWGRSLVPPRGPNRGATIAEDLVIGARGNRPRRMPERILTRRVAACPIADGYELRAVALRPARSVTDWTPSNRGASMPAGTAPVHPDSAGRFVLPARVTQAWIERTAPALDSAMVAPFLRALRERGWSDEDLATRVSPHLRARSAAGL
jgi:hypothetical protein